LGISEIAETHSHQPEALLRPKIHAISQLQRKVVNSSHEEGGLLRV